MKINTQKYIGKKYEHRGKDGFNCLSLVISMLNDNGYNLPEDDGKPIEKDWYQEDPERLIKGLQQYGKRISIGEMQPLDVVVFAFRSIPRHCGIMVDRSRMMHAREGKKVAIIRLKYYQKFLDSVWRIEVVE